MSVKVDKFWNQNRFGHKKPLKLILQNDARCCKNIILHSNSWCTTFMICALENGRDLSNDSFLWFHKIHIMFTYLYIFRQHMTARDHRMFGNFYKQVGLGDMFPNIKPEDSWTIDSIVRPTRKVLDNTISFQIFLIHNVRSRQSNCRYRRFLCLEFKFNKLGSYSAFKT